MATDTFTYQDVLQGSLSYKHDGSDTRADSCVLQVRNSVAASEHQTLEIVIDSVDDGAPRITINAGLMYLDYIHGEPGGVIGPSDLKTTDPDTDPDNIVYEITENCKKGKVINSATGRILVTFTQAQIDQGMVQYQLTDRSHDSDRDQFEFSVRDGSMAIEKNTFHIKFSRLQFEQEQMTVAETENEVKVWIERVGYLNHYAIVTCRSVSEQQLNQQVQFEQGEKRKPCVVPLKPDDEYQGERELQLELSEPTYAIFGQRDSMLLTINDPEDMPTISFLKSEIHVQEETKQLVIPIRREGDASKTATVICYTQVASAGHADFEPRHRLENDQLVFQGTPFNQRDATCTVNLIDDALFEDDEVFYVKLEKASYNARIGKIDTVKVVIDGPNDLPEIVIVGNEIKIGEDVGTLEVEISRTGSDLSQESEVFCYSRPGSAETGFDFEQVQQHIVFGSEQESAICNVDIIDDHDNPVVEGEEHFTVYISSPVGAVLGAQTETKVIIDDIEDDSPKFEFGQAEAQAAETDGVISVPVLRRGDASQEASVICRTLQGSAHIDQDFMERTNTERNRISFAPGETEKPCEVLMIDDEEHELPETLFLQLKSPLSSSPYPALLGDLIEVKVTITNKEDTPTISFAKSEISVREPEPAMTRDVVVQVRRFGDTTGNSRVRVSTRDGSAISGVDYEPKSEMLRFRPGSQQLPFTVTVKCNEKSAWHKTFSLVMGPDEPVNAVLGEFAAMTVTILDKEATGSLVLPAPPTVVSLADFDNPKDAAEPKPGYPLLCLTPCDPQHPNYEETQSLCEEAGINSDLVRYKWEVATPDSSNFERIQDITPWTNPRAKVLDSIYFSRKFRVRCVAQAYSSEGKGGTPLRSASAKISSEGYCHNPLVAGSSGFQAQNFQAELEYLDHNDPDHPNTVHITVEVPHEDGLLPIISTSKIYNIGKFYLSQDLK